MKVIKFFGLIIVALGVLYGGFNAGVYSYVYYKKFQQKRALKKFQEGIKKQEETERQKLMADTYGGKTPQKTLQMFIEAVEKGDYELASRYFILEKQEKELDDLKNAQKKDIKNVLNLLKQSLQYQGKYSQNENLYLIRKPILIEFIKYPSGIWKLTDI
ncbi:MAG: hypothetical protein A3H02_02540 [Candidatus Niyogibacteria bacterium RIFCSPLOWO2_12_FULL_41_13]|uniref:DUF4878 domain-containing protein n=1 Tax=Candidatus Niyogibacteria bacterium RIFCSPLOWO2_12_FULL_41_13 TaxID=1801726 RepID=A0A1G2F1B9_9BACT|nr:MAG: hypothetical protein A3H02_02540 [Candidatus Niyogibacteria bacterium RIFCSPLOWO2_12_FULL_41_13]